MEENCCCFAQQVGVVVVVVVVVAVVVLMMCGFIYEISGHSCEGKAHLYSCEFEFHCIHVNLNFSL